MAASDQSQFIDGLGEAVGEMKCDADHFWLISGCPVRILNREKDLVV